MIKKRSYIILFVIVLTAIAFHLGQHQEKLAQRERVREKNRAKGQEAARKYNELLKEAKRQEASKPEWQTFHNQQYNKE